MYVCFFFQKSLKKKFSLFTFVCLLGHWMYGEAPLKARLSLSILCVPTHVMVRTGDSSGLRVGVKSQSGNEESMLVDESNTKVIYFGLWSSVWITDTLVWELKTQ